MLKNNTLVLERIYNAPIEKVWAAISEREQLKQWCFDFPAEFNLQTGSEFDWYGGEPNGKQWLHRGKFTEIIPGKKLVHTWEYPGYTGKASVSWELTKVDNGSTMLVLTFIILTPFDPKEDALQTKNFVAGWDHIVHTGLKEYLEKLSLLFSSQIH